MMIMAQGGERKRGKNEDVLYFLCFLLMMSIIIIIFVAVIILCFLVYLELFVEETLSLTSVLLLSMKQTEVQHEDH